MANKARNPQTPPKHEGAAVKASPKAQQGSNVHQMGPQLWSRETIDGKLNSIRSGTQSAMDIIIGLRKGFVDGKLLAELMETDRLAENVRGLSQTRIWNSLRQAHKRLKDQAGKDGASDDAKLFSDLAFQGLSCGEGVVSFGEPSNAGGGNRKPRTPQGATVVRQSTDGAHMDTVEDHGGEQENQGISFSQALSAVLAHIQGADRNEGRKMADQVVKMLEVAGFTVNYV